MTASRTLLGPEVCGHVHIVLRDMGTCILCGLTAALTYALAVLLIAMHAE